MRLRPRFLPAALSSAATLNKDSPEFALLEMLKTPLSEQELSKCYQGANLKTALAMLEHCGLIFPSLRDEREYFLDWASRELLRRMETAVNDLAGFGGKLFDPVRGNLGEQTLTELDAMGSALKRLQAALKSERPAYIQDQLESLRPTEILRLNLGCGDYELPDWVNIDLSRGDLTFNLRWGLPFATASVSFVYAAHVLEHFYRDEACALLAEIRRILRPDGVVRLVVPDIGACMKAYAANDETFFEHWAAFWPWAVKYNSKLEYFLAYAGANSRAANITGHQYGYDFETLAGLLRTAGFNTIESCAYSVSRHEDLQIDAKASAPSFAISERHYSLCVEAVA